ncbi:MAG: phosphate ABC transporter substrate-binding protein [Caldilineaceae bacterium]|nr:phosphate ABC transporter substrate-binding protein [Caldilineaceae bacterium]
MWGNRTRAAATALALWLAFVLAACEGASVATPVPVTIRIAGSSAMRPVLRDLISAYTQQHPSVLFNLRGGGSTLGEESIRSGAVEIAASTLFPPAPELGRPAQPGDERLVRTPIGLNGVALIVHPNNGVDELSLVQIRDLYTGAVLDWQALGSDVGEVVLVSREDGSGSRILFEERVMGDERVSLTAVVMPTSEDVVEYVARNPAAIGYVSRSHVAQWIEEEDVEATPPGEPAATPAPPTVKILRVEGQLPTRAALIDQAYALTQPLYLITNGRPTGRVRQFIDFVLSPAGQAIVARYHAPIR